MNQSQIRRTRFVVACGAASALVAASVGVTPASAAPATPAPDAAQETSILSELRQNLARFGSPADVTAFDALDAGQRDELASYLLDPEAAPQTLDQAAARRDHSRASGPGAGFQWGWSGSPKPTELDGRASSRTSWGTQWFAFAGIRLTETKVSETYEYSGSTARKMLGYSCTVVKNVQPFTQVSTSKNSAYVSGGQATAKCKVVVKRGVPTPWGTIAWSTYSAIQRLSAKGNGAVTFNGWQ